MMPIYSPEMECLPPADLEQLQMERLQTTLNRVYRNVAFYRQQFDSHQVDVHAIRSLDALAELPLTTREDLGRSYPYDMFAVPLRDIVRIHSTSGTTGQPLGVGYTLNDIAHWAELVARLLVAVGITDRDFVQIAFQQLTTGTFGFHYGAERVGASVIPASVGDMHEQLRIMRDYKTTALVSMPGYALEIADALDEMDIRPQELNLICGLFGGTPWSEEMRQEIENRLQIKAYDNYGLSEIIGPGISGECQESAGLHVNEDHFLVEVIDPVTLKRQPIGTEGELVFTTLTKEGFPLIRYRTGDLAHLLPGSCPCGRSFVRMSRVSGRCDDLIVVGSSRFFPSRIEECLVQTAGLAPHAELIIQREGAGELLELKVEVQPDFPLLDEMKSLMGLTRQLADRLDKAIGVRPKVSLVEHGTLVRAVGKRKIVVHDKRQ